MNIFKHYTYSWWQIGIFKLALLAIGIIIGANWREVFLPYLAPMIILAVVLSVYIISVSSKQR